MKFRHENKYLINYRDYATIKLRLDGILKKDQNVESSGFYTVRSLYFDDIFNRAYDEKYIGVRNRSKYRIRVYNDSDSVIHLERKIKAIKYIHKQVAPLTRKEVDKIINKDFDFLLKSPHDLHKVFYYESTSNLLRPRVMVEYEREPFVLDAGRLRITFDKNVRAGLEGFDIFNKEMPMIETLDPERLILEVKYTEFLPKLIQEVIPAKASDHAAVSKYIMCCDKTLHKKYSYL